MHAKTVLITGGNTGIGKATAMGLAQKGATVALACRNVEKGEKAATLIRKKTKNDKVSVYPCDLSSFSSIRRCAASINKDFDKLDVLINNAGLFTSNWATTKEGFELTFGVNHLGHFLLTKSLMNHLQSSPNPRIINVTSVAHYHGTIDFNALHTDSQPEKFSGLAAYAQSKLANVLFTKELATRYPNILSNCLHPGVVRTQIGNKHSNWYISLFWHCWKVFMISPIKGAKTPIFLASSKEINGVSGKYFDEYGQEKEAAVLALNPMLARHLWEKSEYFIETY